MAKKRKAGDGLIRQRADGRWEGRYVVGYDDHGYPKTKAVFGKSKRECTEKLAALKAQLGGIPSDKLRPEMRFADWLDYWYETHCKPNIRTSTQSGYEDRIRLHIKPELGEIPLNRLTQNDLQQFYARLKKSGRKTRTECYGEGLSDRMVRMCHATCRSALQRAVQDGLIRTNPAEGCKLPPKKAREMQVLARDELQRFLIQAKAEGYYELFLLDLATGLRRGELLALQWDDLDFETGVLTISKQVSLVRGKIVMSVPKTKNSIRKLVLPSCRCCGNTEKASTPAGCSRRRCWRICRSTPVRSTTDCSSSWSTQTANRCVFTTSDTHSQRWRCKMGWT